MLSFTSLVREKCLNGLLFLRLCKALYQLSLENIQKKSSCNHPWQPLNWKQDHQNTISIARMLIATEQEELIEGISAARFSKQPASSFKLPQNRFSHYIFSVHFCNRHVTTSSSSAFPSSA